MLICATLTAQAEPELRAIWLRLWHCGLCWLASSHKSWHPIGWKSRHRPSHSHSSSVLSLSCSVSGAQDTTRAEHLVLSFPAGHQSVFCPQSLCPDAGGPGSHVPLGVLHCRVVGCTPSAPWSSVAVCRLLLCTSPALGLSWGGGV